MDYLARLKKLKKRRILVLSAASVHSGIQSVYIETAKEGWHIIYHQILPYPREIQEISKSSSEEIHLRNFAVLDNKMSRFYIECCNTTCSHVSKSQKQPDIVVLNRFSLWQDLTDASNTSLWDISIGDPQLLSSTLNLPVITDFVRNNILNRGNGMLPVLHGDCLIGQKAGPIAVFVNIGLIAHISIIDTSKSIVINDSDTGPGTYLINLAAEEAGCADGFDRDGTLCASGQVDPACLEALASTELFIKPGAKSITAKELNEVLNNPCLKPLSPADKLSTLTALTARTIFNFYKQEYTLEIKPDTIWISGGGINNLTLIEYLKAYFSPININSIEELGIPPDSRYPLSLGLAVNAFFDGQDVENGEKTDITLPLGRLFLPAYG